MVQVPVLHLVFISEAVPLAGPLLIQAKYRGMIIGLAIQPLTPNVFKVMQLLHQILAWSFTQGLLAAVTEIWWRSTMEMGMYPSTLT